MCVLAVRSSLRKRFLLTDWHLPQKVSELLISFSGKRTEKAPEARRSAEALDA